MQSVQQYLASFNRRLIFFKQLDATSCVYQFEGLPQQSIVDGHPMPAHVPGVGKDFGFGPDTFRDIRNLQTRRSDVFVLTFPKSGTTWCQSIVYQLIHGELPNALYRQSPMLEFVGVAAVDELESPRLIKSHIHPSLIPGLAASKVIYCARNPKDVAVSYYHHTRNITLNHCPSLRFDDFFECFISGRFEFGDYFDHALQCVPHFADPNWLILRYEDMLRDLPTAVLRIANFLGAEAMKRKEFSLSSLRDVIESSTFSSMKKRSGDLMPNEMFTNGNHHLRVGKARNWKNYLSKEQSDLVDAKFSQKLGHTEMKDWWKDDMTWTENYSLAELTQI